MLNEYFHYVVNFCVRMRKKKKKQSMYKSISIGLYSVYLPISGHIPFDHNHFLASSLSFPFQIDYILPSQVHNRNWLFHYKYHFHFIKNFLNSVRVVNDIAIEIENYS